MGVVRVVFTHRFNAVKPTFAKNLVKPWAFVKNTRTRRMRLQPMQQVRAVHNGVFVALDGQRVDEVYAAAADKSIQEIYLGALHIHLDDDMIFHGKEASEPAIKVDHAHLKLVPGT
eukprot:4556483-Prymnesium_polylepis.4